MERIRVIDSHTGGEPTRVVIEGIDLANMQQLSIAARRDQFSSEFDHMRSAIVNEPRGFDAMVGALLCKPNDENCDHGVIFFNNVGCIGMCVHGTIGLAETLFHLGKLQRDSDVRIETPVGIVTAKLESDGRVTVENVPSYRYKADVPIEVEGYGLMHGDVAWGGNWFFLINDHKQPIRFDNRDRLRDCCLRIRASLQRDNITGADETEIDHIELFAPPETSDADSKNFVLCPGGEYDRSPCGTGTSAKIACLLDAGKLKPGEIWRQESIVGSIFQGWGEPTGKSNQARPFIQGSAHMTAESTLLIDPNDSLRYGIQ